jgi:hypothetical protein|tara:strand:- start:750 stop:917 length:168 start_codon:yes stop_codon:yes gene_type:complete
MSKSKIRINVSAEVDSQEFTLDKEELPFIMEEMLQDLFHEIIGMETKDVTVKVIR